MRTFMSRARTFTLVALAGMVLPLVLLTAGPATSAAQPPFAPYMEMSGPNPANLTSAITEGLKRFTAAFVIGKKCTGVWDDGVALTDTTRTTAITNAQNEGVQAVLSFGGQAGRDLARTCSNLTSLTAAYQSAITRFNVTRIDFDIEGAAIDPKKQKTQIARRFSAIRALEQANPSLVVSLTIPTGPSGLESSGLTLLQTAQSTATRIDAVNIMAMDYGNNVSDMGATAIAAAKGALTQIQTVWPTFTYAKLGITPMIGQNDSAGEVLTIAQAKNLVAWSKTNGIGWLAFWSLNRDLQCTGSPTKAQDNCSGTTQTARQFTKVFLGLA
jgi:chitinase